MHDPEPQNESPCALCSTKTGGCCKVVPGGRHNAFPLSVAELKRLLPFALLATDDSSTENKDNSFSPDTALANTLDSLFLKEHASSIAVTEDNTPEFTQIIHALIRNASQRISDIFPYDGTHLRLKTRSDGFCVFVDLEGCRLPRDVRPWYCQIFPIWVVGREITLFIQKDCHIAQMAKTPLQALSLLGVTRNDIYFLHKNLLEDWNLSS